MKLFTKAILKKTPALYATEKVALADKVAICKFFTPWANWTWYVVETDGNTCFGLVEGFETELGYFSISELEQVVGTAGLKIERDKWFTPTKLSELMK